MLQPMAMKMMKLQLMECIKSLFTAVNIIIEDISASGGLHIVLLCFSYIISPCHLYGHHSKSKAGQVGNHYV